MNDKDIEKGNDVGTIELTTEQYMDAVTNGLTKLRQIRFLQNLYEFPNATATPKEMSMVTFGHPRQGTNLRIGTIGKLIAAHCKISLSKNLKPYQLVSQTKINGAWVMNKNLQLALIKLKLVGSDAIEHLPTEIERYEADKKYTEGKLVSVSVNRYERSIDARNKCIQHHGCTCKACEIKLEDVYGDIAEGFIHVHHKVPLHTIPQEYRVDPINDLIPLCPNCHSVIHLSKKPMTVENLQELIKRNKKS